MNGEDILLPVLIFVMKGTWCRVDAAETEEAVAAVNATIAITDGLERERGATRMALLLLPFLFLAKNVVAEQITAGPVL